MLYKWTDLRRDTNLDQHNWTTILQQCVFLRHSLLHDITYEHIHTACDRRQQSTAVNAYVQLHTITIITHCCTLHSATLQHTNVASRLHTAQCNAKAHQCHHTAAHCTVQCYSTRMSPHGCTLHSATLKHTNVTTRLHTAQCNATARECHLMAAHCTVQR